MVVCKFFLQGECRFGENCRFEHQLNSEKTGNQQFGNTQTQNKIINPKTGTEIEISTLINSVQNDVVSGERGRQWLLSCYAPFKEKPLYPGFIDLSFEEIRFGYIDAQKSNTLEQYNQGLQQILTEAKARYKTLENPTKEIVLLLKSIYNNELSSTSNQNYPVENKIGLGSSTNPSLFGQKTMSVFGQQKSLGGGSSIFGQQNNSQTNVNFGQQTGSIFGQSSAPLGTGSIFGATSMFQQKNTTPNDGNAFVQQQSKSSIFGQKSGSIFGQQPNGGSIFDQQNTNPTGTSIFGKTNSSQDSGIFGQQNNIQNSSSIFGQQNTTQNNSSPFGKPNTDSIFGRQSNTGNIFGQQSSTNVFGSQTNATSVFGQQNNAQSGTNVFGLQNTAQSGTNVFGQQNNPQSATNVFGQKDNAQSSTNVFGQQKPTQNTNSIFGSNVQAGSTIFGQQNSVQTGGSIFGQQNSLQSSGSIFGQQNSVQVGGSGQPNMSQNIGNNTVLKLKPQSDGSKQNSNSPFSGIFGNAQQQPLQPQNSQSGSIFARTSEQTKLFASQNSNSPLQATNNPAPSIFGLKSVDTSLSASISGKTVKKEIKSDAYSKLEDLTEEEIKSFNSDVFDINTIPVKPPTFEMCF